VADKREERWPNGEGRAERPAGLDGTGRIIKGASLNAPVCECSIGDGGGGAPLEGHRPLRLKVAITELHLHPLTVLSRVPSE